MEEMNALSPSTTRDRTNRTCRTLDRHRFENEELEALFYRYDAKIRKSWVCCLIVILIILSVCLSIIGFVYYRSATAQNVFLAIQCGVCLCLLVYINTKWLTEGKLLVVCWIIYAMCLVFCVISLPVDFGDRHGTRLTAADGVWETALIVFLVYAFLPFKFYIALGTGVFLPVVHLIVSVLMTTTGFSELLWRTLSSNAMIYVAVNCCGTYIHDRGEYIRRKCFLDTRNCISARLQVDEERNKLEQILLNILPPHVAMEMKRDMTRQRDGILHKSYLQQHELVSILYADIVSFSPVNAQCSPQDSIKFLNELFGRFDQLAKDHHCLRVKLLGDCYFAVCGLPEGRPDQAKCAVELGLDMIDTVLAIQDTSEVRLQMRVGIHTGRVVAGVLGQKRWQYDLWSEAVETARQLELVGEPGKVALTQATLDNLHGEYDVCSAANSVENSAFLRQRGTEAYFIVTTHPRRQSSFVRGKDGRYAVKNINDMGMRLMQSVRCSAELPFTQALSVSMEDKNPMLNGPVDHEKAAGKPFKKRGFGGRGTEDRINRHLEMAIATRSIDRDKDGEMNPVTLTFRKASRERRYHSSEDTSFSGSIVGSLLILLCLATIQALILPRTILLLILFLVTFSWIAFILILLLGAKLKCLTCELLRSPFIRISIVVITSLLVYSVAQVNVFSCVVGGDTLPPITAGYQPAQAVTPVVDSHLICRMPQYIYLSCLVSFLVVALFLKVSTLIKLVLLVAMSTGYVVLIMYYHPGLFHNLDSVHDYKIPSAVIGVIAILHFIVTLFTHGRQVEWIYRLDFLWRSQCTEERIELTELQNHSRQLLCNVLPTHIVPKFIDMGQKKSMELYSQLYQKVGVLFVNIPDLGNYYVQQEASGKPQETIRALNEIIIEYDELLNEERFCGVEKIKSFGTNYMAAVGLAPERAIQEIEDSLRHHLGVLVEFALAVRTKIHTVGQTYGMHLSFQAGINSGPVISGVIGSRRGQFDIYGETVNMACLLERTSKVGYIQVPDDVFRPLRYRYDFHCQGPMPIKGRGHMTTYLLLGKRAPNSPGLGTGANRMPHDHWRKPPKMAGMQNNNVIRTSINEPFDLSSFRLMEGMQDNTKQPVPAHAAALGMTNVAPIKPLVINPVNEQPLGYSRYPTPPGSMGNRRKGGFDGDTGVQNDTRKIGGNPALKSFLAPMEPSYTRIESPELPAIHFRNVFMQSGSLPSRTENPVKNLTQSQILHGTKRPGSRGSLSGLNELEQSRKRNRTPLSPSHFDEPPKFGQPNNEITVAAVTAFNRQTPTKESPKIAQNVHMEKKKPRTTPQRLLYSPHSPTSNKSDETTPSPTTKSVISASSNTPTRGEYRGFSMDKDDTLTRAIREVEEACEDVFVNLDDDSTLDGGEEKDDLDHMPPSAPILQPRRTQSARSDSAVVVSKPPANITAVAAKGRSSSVNNHQYSHGRMYNDLNQGGYMHQPPELYPMQIRSNFGNKPPGINELKPAIDAEGGNSHTQRALRLSLLNRQNSDESNLSGSALPQLRAQLKEIVPPRPAPPKRDVSSSGWQLRPLQDVIRARQLGELTDSSLEPSERASPEPSPPPLPPPPTEYEGPMRANNIHDDIPEDYRLDLDTDDIHIPDVEQSGKVPYESAFKPVPHKVAVTVPLCKTPEESEDSFVQKPKHKPKRRKENKEKSAIDRSGDRYGEDSHGLQALVSPGVGGRNAGKPPSLGQRPTAAPYQVKRRGPRTPVRKCRSLDYIPADAEDGDCSSISSSRGVSPPTHGIPPEILYPNIPRDMHKYLLPDNISLSSIGSSEISKSDPAINYDSSSNTYESEYDNYRPGMASDEDMFVPEPVSDMDIDIFDEIDFDQLTVSDKYSLDLPLPKLFKYKKEKITDV